MKHVKLMRVKMKEGPNYERINKVEEINEGKLKLSGTKNSTTEINPDDIEEIKLYEARV